MGRLERRGAQVLRAENAAAEGTPSPLPLFPSSPHLEVLEAADEGGEDGAEAVVAALRVDVVLRRGRGHGVRARLHHVQQPVDPPQQRQELVGPGGGGEGRER